jgi:prepilin-type N-terminal cleavage/methylation domain-containing protein
MVPAGGRERASAAALIGLKVSMLTANAHRKAVVSPARPVRRRGFTLVEILMVVLILGIASAIIAPQVNTRNDVKVRAAARLLVADLLYAQNLAIAQQKDVYVKFDDAAENYRLMSDPAAGSEIKHPITKADKFITQFGAAADSRMSNVNIQSAVFNGVDTTYRPTFTLAFDELGQPFVYSYGLAGSNEMNDGTVVLQCGTDTITVSIERYTGEIKVQ